MSDHMGPKMLMARMTARGVVIADARGGRVLIETTDVAAALAMGERKLSEEAYVMGRVKYCDDDLYRPRLARLLFARLARVAGREPPEGIVSVCLREGIWRPVHRSCEGRGCPRCGGTGLMRAASRDRAKRAGVPKTTYSRVWARPVERVLMNMDGWAQECLWHLVDQFSRQLPREAKLEAGEVVRYRPFAPEKHPEIKKVEKNYPVKNQPLWPVLKLPKSHVDGETF